MLTKTFPNPLHFQTYLIEMEYLHKVVRWKFRRLYFVDLVAGNSCNKIFYKNLFGSKELYKDYFIAYILYN